MKNISIFISAILLIITTSCGFKVVNKLEKINFNINRIDSSGDKKINYKIKSRLTSASKNTNQNNISININSKKVKEIKEKNINNEITKYQISIYSNIKIQRNSSNKEVSFSVSETGDFNVTDQYSQTLNNEKRLIELLSNSLADNILDEIIRNTNDL